MIKRLKAKQTKDGKLKRGHFDIFLDPWWSGELGPSTKISEKRFVWEKLGVLRSRAYGARCRKRHLMGIWQLVGFCTSTSCSRRLGEF